ncbi:hypothetical protein HHK36_033144 [Tetracentron sinense]|uniref:Uncharacterized protein n=1 Tax=Tetracentron sinense TaxID=13715 RepID=A0A834Y3V9_TETSI|nr:hypothetical protein HHK36_033144 [Tetracentron sinense]
MEMNRMKEENEVLRKVVEQSMKDYYDLQMKFAIIQQNGPSRNTQPSTTSGCNCNGFNNIGSSHFMLLSGANSSNPISESLPKSIQTSVPYYSSHPSSSHSSAQLNYPWVPNNSSYHNSKTTLNTGDFGSDHHFNSPQGVDKKEWKVEVDKSLAENVSAIASDPKFRVAVAAAITSFISKESQTVLPTGPSFVNMDGENASSSINKWVVESSPFKWQGS